MQARKCAEILVPNQVDPRFLIGAYVLDKDGEKKFGVGGFNLAITIDAGLFFR
jgi:hypothetical protein